MTNQLLIVLSYDDHVTHFIDRSKLFLESLIPSTCNSSLFLQSL